MSRRVERAVTVFPEADSPTSASFSPASSVNEARSTTLREPKWMLRSRTSSRLICAAPSFQPTLVAGEHLARIERVAQGIADKDEEHQHDDEHAEGRARDPPRIQVLLRLVEQLAEARRSRGHAQEIGRA